MSAEFNSPEFNDQEFNSGSGGGGGFSPGDLNVFPSLGCVGYSASHQYRETLRIYDDGTYRRRLRPSFEHKPVNLEFKGIKQSVKDAITTFFNARKPNATTNGDLFFFYNPEEATAVDPTGVATTGRHVAIFMDDTLSWARDSRLTWSASLKFFLLS